MKKRAGFTMIELIFVIVILGILAAVAIPKLAATRDDAQISKIVTNISTIQSEISGYVLSQGTVPLEDTNLSLASNTYAAGKGTGYIVLGTGASATTGTVAMGVTGTGAGNVLRIAFRDGGTDATSAQVCAVIDLNSTTMFVHDNNVTTSNICVGVIAQVTDANISLAGQRVVY